MDVIRRWIFRPKRTDTSLLALFFYADRDLNLITDQLEKFDGHKNVDQFTSLLTELRKSQDSLLSVIEKIMDEAIPEFRANRDFRVKFPDDILQESLAGRLWFGAECLAAGSSIINHEVESQSMQPLSKLVTRQLSRVRTLLREQSLRSTNEYSIEICNALTEFDNSFAEFELCYVSAMVPVKTMRDYDLLQDVAVLFSDTVQRALRLGWLSQDQLDMYDPALMFTIPRMAVICGLLVYPEGPLNPDMNPSNMSEMFRPFQLLLQRIRDLLWTLDMKELWILELLLSKGKDPSELDSLTCFEELNCGEHPWMNDAYGCKALTERTRLRDGSSKITSFNIVVDGSHDVSIFNGLSGISELLEEVVRSCGHEQQQELVIASVENNVWQNQRDAEPSRGTEAVVSDDSKPLNDSQMNTSSITPYDISQNWRSPRTDSELLSSQISEALCIPDCSSIQHISCGCQEIVPFPESTLGTEHPESVVPGRVEMMENEREPTEFFSLSDEQKKCSNVCAESDSMGASLYDSLEISQTSGFRDVTGFGYDWDRESYTNLVSNSSSLCCDDNDEEAMKLAIEKADTTAREEMRSHFKDSMDLIHRLFVCISGIADQLQTNFASDLRHILKVVFDCNTSSSESTPNEVTKAVGFSGLGSLSPIVANSDPPVCLNSNELSDRPRWIPDDESPVCTSCQAAFTFMRRRHHCRNCGKVFCGQCSSNTVPLPRYGHEKPVRVCNHCFLFCVTPFTINN